jgi:hypothetical protein
LAVGFTNVVPAGLREEKSWTTLKKQYREHILCGYSWMVIKDIGGAFKNIVFKRLLGSKWEQIRG